MFTEQEVTEGDFTKNRDGKNDASAHALFLNFIFDGKLRLDRSSWPERSIEQQLLYSIGQLNGERSVGRLDLLELSEIKTTPLEEGGVEISYHAKLIVAWGKSRTVFPEDYTLLLPYDTTTKGLEAFTEKYKDNCVDYSAHDVDPGSMWYYYRPLQQRCTLEEEEIVRAEGRFEISEVTTTKKYPEYDRVWEDNTLKVVAIFGHAEEDMETSWDSGVSGYKNFYSRMKTMLSDADAEVQVTPEIESLPTKEQTEFHIDALLEDGRRVEITGLSVTNVRTAGRDFDQRYHELSAEADLIVYNGHAGLGANIRALARKGDWKTGQYVIVFMNGCDTYAYVDDALFEAHARVNPDDPKGSKYVDIINNAMPSYFSSMPKATAVLVKGLFDYNNPLNYEQIFKDIDSNQIVLVTGEEDNTFVPNAGEEAQAWEGLTLEGTVERGEEITFETPMLEVGTYQFVMDGTKDADLHIRIGLRPDQDTFDCRPYRVNSQETCKLVLDRPAHLFGMVRGWSPQSEFTLIGSRVKEDE